MQSQVEFADLLPSETDVSCAESEGEVTDVVVADFYGDGVPNAIFITTKAGRNQLYSYSSCHQHGGFVGDGYAARGAVCHLCPAYSVGTTLSTKQCKFCPGGKVGTVALDGTPIRGWDHDQEFACSACVAGRYRSVFQQTDTCTVCPVGRYAGVGASECSKCAADRITDLSTPGATQCVKCPVGQRPDDAGTACVCDTNHYNSSYGLIFCFDGDYHSDKLQSDDYSTTRVQLDSGQVCLQCPACVQCNAGTAPTLVPGFSLSPIGLEIWGSNLDNSVSSPRSAFRCAVDGKVCHHGNNTAPSASGTLAPVAAGQLNGQCAEGHLGSLCGVCASDWKGSFGSLCEPCSANDWRVLAVGLLLLLVVTGCLYARLKKKAEETQGRLDDMRARYALARKAMAQARKIQSEVQEAVDDQDEEGAFQATLDTVKIVVSNLQIIAQLPVTLKFSCPVCKNMQQMMSFLPAVNLDVLRLFSVDCLATVGLYQRFVYMLLGPAVVIVLVALWGQTGHSKVQVLAAGVVDSAARGHDRSTKANQIIMLVIFLIYPSVSTTIFSVFSCRSLDFDQSIQVFDASIDCNSGDYKALRAGALVALVLVPVGVPVGFAWLLFKNRSRLSRRLEDTISFELFSSTARNVLREKSLEDGDLRRAYDLIDIDKSGEVSSEELWRSALHTVLSSTAMTNEHLVSDSEELRGSEAAPSGNRNVATKIKWWEGGPDEYRFLVRAYEPRYFYYELVHYAKKCAS